jgi:hypothetical protein
MFVRGVDAAGSVFLDLTKTFDISATGAFLASTRMLAVDTAPSPVATGYTRVPPETPPIQARIRRQEHDGGDLQFVGVEFLKALG